MKTIVIVLLASMFSLNAVAFAGVELQRVQIGDEAYVDDIPFNTESITSAYQESKKLMDQTCLKEEAYIDDIPFSTLLVYEMKRDTKNFAGDRSSAARNDNEDPISAVVSTQRNYQVKAVPVN